MFTDKNLPAGPSEAEVLEHFGDKIPPGSKLMRPPYTSIWALEDGTLLWDWRNGFSDARAGPGRALKRIMYVTGPRGSGKSSLVNLMPNAVEVSVNMVNSRLEANILGKIEANASTEVIAFTSHDHSYETKDRIMQLAEEFGAKFYNITIKRN